MTSISSAGLRNACHYRCGLIDYAEYIASEQKLAESAPPELALQHELETARLQHLSARDHNQRATGCAHLRDTVARILADQDASRAFKLKARIVQLYADASEANTQCIHHLMCLRMRKDMRLDMGSPGVIRALDGISRPIMQLIEESKRLLEEARIGTSTPICRSSHEPGSRRYWPYGELPVLLRKSETRLHTDPA